MSSQNKAAKIGIKKRTVMTNDDRLRANVLMVESNVSERSRMRQSLTGLGFGSYIESSDHVTGLQRLQERHISHILFQSTETNMPATEFLRKALELDENLICVPTTYEPDLDEIFALLVYGARGYLVKPFTGETLEDALNWATYGDPISEAILFAKDRNEALTSLVMSNLDRLAHVMRQARTFETADRELTLLQSRWKKSVEMAMLFGKGGPTNMVEYFVDFTIDRCQGPASVLGRARKRLNERKQHLAQQAEKRKLLTEIQALTEEAKKEHEQS